MARGVIAVSCTLYVGRVDGRTVLRITGDIDRSNVHRLEDTLALIDSGPIDVDCAKLDFIDATGIHALAEAARAHGEMRLRNPPKFLSRLVDALELRALLRLS
jgi:anti-anti-sigma factor